MAVVTNGTSEANAITIKSFQVHGKTGPRALDLSDLV